MAGGTDLLVEMKMGRKLENVVSLNMVSELNEISEDTDFVFIGPTVTFRQIQDSPIIQKYIPHLIDTVSKIGSPQIRNTGTVGGNVCTCASCSDSAPTLIAYNSEVEISSSTGIRRINLTDLQLFHRKTSISKREVLSKIIIPKPKPNFTANFQKFGLRESASISVGSVAVGLWIENSQIADANIVVGACAPTPIKCNSAMQLIINAKLSDLQKDSILLNEIAEATASDTNPIDDIRGSADYRKDIIKTITKRAILNSINDFNQ
ncbi:MAG: hypothetical protein A2X64_08475 [Ignavibacteria bacterium GWF2_33_9]|nr:MAG: hypothetical protein A2X64_08475 [Ignavibacteria bacterium GWF2_33_9]